jgi:hypothetical protein
MQRDLCKQEASTLGVRGWKSRILEGLTNEGREEVWDEREVLGSSTPGTVSHRLRPKIRDKTSSLQQQKTGELYTPYQIWPHHSWLKRRSHQPKKN